MTKLVNYPEGMRFKNHYLDEKDFSKSILHFRQSNDLLDNLLASILDKKIHRKLGTNLNLLNMK